MKIYQQAQREKTAKEIINGLQQQLKLKAIAQHNKTSGHLNIKKVISQISRNMQVLDTRIFSKDRVTEKEHDVLILLDLSGSMDSGLYRDNKTHEQISRIEESISSIYSLGIVLSELNLNYSIYSFGTTRNGDKTLFLRIKPFSKKMTKEKLKTTLEKVEINEYAKTTDTATAINTAREILLREGKPENKKLMIVLTDGHPEILFSNEMAQFLNCYSKKERENFLINATNQAIEQATKDGIKTLAISLSDDSNDYLSESKFTQKVYLTSETISKGNFNKNLINAYLKAIKGGIN